VTGDRSSRTGGPRGADPERLLAGLRFAPRASLGPEIAGRVRRGEVARGVLPPQRARVARWLVAAALLGVAVPAGLVAYRRLAGPVVRVDQCCRNLDGGRDADDGYLVHARGRRIERLVLYQDLDGDRRYSATDRVLLVRGPHPSIVDDSVAGSVRICCVDLDGEGPADDGLLVLNSTGERVVLAGIFEQDLRAPTPVLR
jgi:hypothetical protein